MDAYAGVRAYGKGRGGVRGQHLRQVEKEIGRMVRHLIRRQQPDGRWISCFESGTMTDAYMILLMKVCGWENPTLTRRLVKRIISRQDATGTWKLFADEKEGNLSATIDSSVALLYAGAYKPNHPKIRKAREFVLSRGGLDQAGSLTRVMLTLMGHLNWRRHPGMPIRLLLLPRWFPINFYDFVGYTRMHVAPMLIVADRRFSVRLPKRPNLSNWIKKEGKISDVGTISWLEQEVERGLRLDPSGRGGTEKEALRYGEKMMLERIEPDGTLYGYFSTTFLMVFALLALGYPRNHPVIRNALKGLQTFLYPLENGMLHMQEATSTVWDTSLILYALGEAGVKKTAPVFQRGAKYLLSRQHKKLGDWALKNPGVPAGGWGFSDVNTINPDVDDTGSSLRALQGLAQHHPERYGRDWRRGLNWLISMQNRDGGWPAFEKNTDKKWPHLLPFEDGHSVWTDPSSADLTGRAVEFLGSLGWTSNEPIIRRAVDWLIRNQRRDGSWFGRWGVTYIYGTWAALTGLAAVGISPRHPTLERGRRWLLSIQNKDGGWGESCASDTSGEYISLNASTPIQTAWALDALIALHDEPTPEIEAGISCLLRLLRQKDWRTVYPTGAGLAGQFYIHYHSYRYVWPLVTLSHYRKKYGKEER